MKLKDMFSAIEYDLDEVEKYLTDCFAAANERLRAGFMYLLKAGGKRIRPAFTLLCSRYGSTESEHLIPVASSFEMLHMASLVHDDVIDSSNSRRGRPTIRSMEGNEYSLHFGDYLFAKALAIIDQYNNEKLNIILAYTCLEMCRGEMEQLASEFDYRQNIRNYLYRIKRKTSLLMSLCCQAGSLIGGAAPEAVAALGRYGYNIGMAYQITDDVLDYIADEETLGKPVGADIKQGILTLPLFYFFRCAAASKKEEIRKILDKGRITEDDFACIAGAIKETEAINLSLGMANRFVEKAGKELEALPDNETTAVLYQLARFIHHRQY